jgi:DNA (cytosine-5)-methyltransferase 1
MNQFTVISTFAGMGGSSQGYKQAGGKVLLAVEFDANAIATYRANHPATVMYADDIAKLSVNEALDLTGLQPGEIDIFDGSPPCQGFSTAGKRILSDERNQLFREYVRLLAGLQPRAFVMENVSGMVKGKMRLIFAEVIKALQDAGYQVACRLLDASFYGVPQQRKRLIFIGARNDLGIIPTHPTPQTMPVKVIDAIGHLADAGGPTLYPSTARLWPRMKWGQDGGEHHPNGSLFNFAKLHPYKVCPTVVKNAGSGRLCHWKHPRFLSREELLILGGFPADYKLIGSDRNVQERVGNSVPPPLMEAIARHVHQTIIIPSKGVKNAA